MKRSLALGVVLLLAATMAHAADNLIVTFAGPSGEISKLEEAAEIRVTFSEPMVALARPLSQAGPSFFHVAPTVQGSFRWAGTTTLILTPDPKHPLPFATRFAVTIDGSAKSLSGSTLGAPYQFDFTTPSLRLVSTIWIRKDNGAIVMALRFNQPVSAATLGDHLHLQYQDHPFEAPSLSSSQKKLLTPAQQQLFAQKVSRAAGLAASNAPLLGFFPTTWDRKRFPPAPDTVVFESQPGVPAGSWVSVSLDEGAVGAAAGVTPGMKQQYVIQLEHSFFVKDLECLTACNPDDYNPIRLTTTVPIDEARQAVTVTDITDPAHPTALRRDEKRKGVSDNSEDESPDYSNAITFEDVGYHHIPGHRYIVRIASTLKASDGEVLGYDWADTLEDWHQRAFTSFGEGHGVWEVSGGSTLPLYVRNLKAVDQWVSPLPMDDLLPTILKLEASNFVLAPEGTPRHLPLSLPVDAIHSIGIDASNALHQGTGLAWIAVREGDAIPRSHQSQSRPIEGSVVQVTNLGISVKDSPQNSLILVTRLDNGAPVDRASVTIRTLDNKVFWSGKTDSHGVAVAPKTSLRTAREEKPKATSGDDSQMEDETDYSAVWQLKFIVTAEKEGDAAYLESTWNEGILPWDFSLEFNLGESIPLIRGSLFTDRGVYKLGEEVHLKAVLRSDTPDGVRLLPAGTEVTFVVRDSRNKEVERRTAKLSEWSSADLTFKVPVDGSLGDYSMSARIENQRGAAGGSFLVAAYRRPDFRVDATMGPSTAIAGATLNATVTGRYLFGAAMSGRDVRWTYTKERVNEVPSAVDDLFPPERYTFLGFDPSADERPGKETISTKDAKLGSKGELALQLPTEQRAGFPIRYVIEGEVQDISRQKIAGRAGTVVAPASWYIGLKTPPYFVEQEKGLDTEVAAVGPDGHAVPGVKVDVHLIQLQWNSVRRAEGNGFYTWETERKVLEKGNWTITTTDHPVPLHVPIETGGSFFLKAIAEDGQGRSTTTFAQFYALGSGYTAWARYDHNRIDLVPERKSYRPGETARIMIQSPWETATAVITTEREGIRSHREIQLSSTQQTVEVPITEADIPNVFVSVLLVKGRTSTKLETDGSDPGKPSFRLGYTELQVVDTAKKLKVTVKANRDEYRPAAKAKVSVEVTDAAGKPTRSEVTLWAVDYGVLSLTGYRTPDVVSSVYIRKALQVLTEDSRQKIISRRVVVPKGGDDGGGGGADAGPGTVRKDFRVLAFWLGSVVTDKRGHASVDVTLPESLTTYRIMAVAADKESRFGWGEREIRTNKPVLLLPAFPRFLASGDHAFFGSVVQNQLSKGGKAEVSIRSLDPSILEITGPLTQTVDVPASGAAEVRFPAVAKSVGNARVEMAVRLLGESDTFQDTIPVRILAPPEVVAAYGVAKPDATEQLEIPKNALPDVGGLHLDLASTAMVGLGEGARYLVEYPYGCAEQRSSRALALLLTADLGEAFRLPGIDPANLKSVVQSNLDLLRKYQCPNGAFAFWAGECSSASPYLTSYVLHVMQRARDLGYTIDQQGMEQASTYLEGELSRTPEPNEGWWPAYTSWQAWAVKVLSEEKRNEDSQITRIFGYRDRMPHFAQAWLLDALRARGETSGSRVDDLHRRVTNAILPEGGSAHVEEMTDPYLYYYWNSNVRSSAIVLHSLVAGGTDETLVRGLVHWLLAVRKDGRWSNTQENALALEGLVDYYRRYESEVPSFTATASLSGKELASAKFEGRSTVSVTRDVPMRTLQAGTGGALTLHREGTGTLYYMTALKYAVNEMHEAGLDRGFLVDRHYYVVDRNATGDDGTDDLNQSRTSFKAGDLVRVVLTFDLPKERRYVAVNDPLPAGLEPVESWFATTASDLVKAQQEPGTDDDDWMSWWKRGGFDHVERHDDRVLLFATRLAAGSQRFSYLARATTAGSFVTAPTHAEEMYEPEVFGRTRSDAIEVKP
jgi:uncharacterized protein YfaS (alpha-2-macroglobulin family)